MNPSEPEDMSRRVSHSKLTGLEDSLLPQDISLLRALVQCRFMSTNQMIRFAFGDIPNPDSARRAANRSVARLRNGGLIAALERRIGGIRAGSGSFVWFLAPAGARYLSLESPEKITRRRKYEPSAFFVQHTIAITELYVQLACMKGITLAAVQFEPACWRNFPGTLGVNQTLKPDLYSRTTDGEYEDDWFFELDLASESSARVIQKCVQYQHYYLSGAEQRKNGVFPLVAWIVPNENRKTNLREHIARSIELRHKNLFTVILPDELETLIRRGAVT